MYHTVHTKVYITYHIVPKVPVELFSGISVNATRHCTPNRLVRRTSNLVPSSPPFSLAGKTPATPWTTAASDDGSNTRTSPDFISNACLWAIPEVWTWKVTVRPRLNKTTQLPSLQWSMWGGKQNLNCQHKGYFLTLTPVEYYTCTRYSIQSISTLGTRASLFS